jgi:hypothetical protein
VGALASPVICGFVGDLGTASTAAAVPGDTGRTSLDSHDRHAIATGRAARSWRNGAELQIYVNDEFASGRHYETRELAVIDADARRELLLKQGWTENATKGGA